MLVNHVRFRLTYVSPPSMNALPLQETYDLSPTMCKMEPVTWFKNMVFESQRMMLHISKSCHKNGISFNKDYLFWNMWTWSEETPNMFTFGKMS